MPCGSMRSLYVSKPGVASSSSRRAAPLASSQSAKEMAEWSRWSVRGAHECVRDVVGWFATGLSTPAFFASVLLAASIVEHRREFRSPLSAVLHSRVASALYDSHQNVQQDLAGRLS